MKDLSAKEFSEWLQQSYREPPSPHIITNLIEGCLRDLHAVRKVDAEDRVFPDERVELTYFDLLEALTFARRLILRGKPSEIRAPKSPFERAVEFDASVELTSKAFDTE